MYLILGKDSIIRDKRIGHIFSYHTESNLGTSQLTLHKALRLTSVCFTIKTLSFWSGCIILQLGFLVNTYENDVYFGYMAQVNAQFNDTYQKRLLSKYFR